MKKFSIFLLLVWLIYLPYVSAENVENGIFDNLSKDADFSLSDEEVIPSETDPAISSGELSNPKDPIEDFQSPEILEQMLYDNYYEKAKLLIINKMTAKSGLLIVDVGSSTFFNNIRISPLKCWKSSARNNSESKMFVNIVESKIDEDSKTIFKGWLFSSSASLSTLEHPIYEVIAIDCIGKKLPPQKSTPAQKSE